MQNVTREEAPDLSNREWTWIEDCLLKLPKNTAYETRSFICSLIMNLNDTYKREGHYIRLFEAAIEMSGLDTLKVYQQAVNKEYGVSND